MANTSCMNITAVLLALALAAAPIAAQACLHPAYERANAANGLAQLGEVNKDCGQTVTILQAGGNEINGFTPRQVTTANRAGHPFLCKLFGGGIVVGEFALARCWHPIWMTIGTTAEGYNIGLNWAVITNRVKDRHALFQP